MLADAVASGTDPLGFRVAYLSGITQLIQRRGLLAPMPAPAGLIPFRNGLLDPVTRVLTPATPGRAMTWSLPYDYDPGADCPTVRAWLSRCVEGDAATVELLRAWLAALVRGVPLQKFLLLLGRGGSGKGTFQRLAAALVGPANTAISTLRDMENNRFEAAKWYGKRLLMVNEAGKHGGSVNMLKALTGGDHLPLERKNVQQSGSFVFSGLVLIATNDDLRTTDLTSGLERRRVTVRFPTTATLAERASWDARGGEAAVLHREIPGVINWCLAVPADAIRSLFDAPPSRVATDNLLGMAAGNSVADWLLSETMPDPATATQIGKREERRDPSNGRVYFEGSDSRLYPSYLAWCLVHARQPIACNGFRAAVANLAGTLGHPLAGRQNSVTRAMELKGIRLARDGETPKVCTDAWAASSEGTVKVPRRHPCTAAKEPKVLRENSGQFFAPQTRAPADVVEVEA